MKKLLHLVAFVLTVGTAAAQTIPNGGFETWNITTWLDPTGYTSANDQYVPFGVPGTVVRVTPGQHANYAVQLTTDTIRVGGVKDTLQAYIANGNPGNGFTGGIPYALKPTGMRFYYKCNVVAGDTALVIVVFKKLGSAIGECEAKLTGTVGAYTLHTQAALIFGTPDSIVVAAASSNLLLNNFHGYPGSTLTIDSLTFTGVASQPANFNGDFENWTTDTSGFPALWTGSYPGVYQTTDKKGGTYAVELKTVAATSFNNAQPGYVTTGYANVGNNSGGNPFTNQIDTLEFYYKYATSTNDSANVSLTFKNHGAFVNGFGMTIDTAKNYTLFKFPFNTGGTVDSAIIAFQSTNIYQLAANHVGSVLKVDNVEYASNPTIQSVNNLPSLGNLKVYPNPVKDVVNIYTSNVSGQIQTISLYDLSGKLLESSNHPNITGSTISFNMSNYASDLYIIRVTTDKGNYFQKVDKL